MIKFQQSQALTSHLESFWSIVQMTKSEKKIDLDNHILLRIGNLLASRVGRASKNHQPISHILIYGVTDNFVFSF